MRQRLPLVLSITALVVTLFGATPLGQAAASGLAAVPAFAKTAGFAKSAGNSSKLNGHKSSITGVPGTIPVIGKDGKLPASIGAVGQQGQQGAAGAKGDKGDKGENGDNGATHVVVRRSEFSSPSSGQISGSANCVGAGERATGGGYDAGGNGANIIVFHSQPSPATQGATPTGWDVLMAVSGSTHAVLTVYVVCASP
jgi:hypothetical protein